MQVSVSVGPVPLAVWRLRVCRGISTCTGGFHLYFTVLYCSITKTVREKPSRSPVKQDGPVAEVAVGLCGSIEFLRPFGIRCHSIAVVTATFPDPSVRCRPSAGGTADSDRPFSVGLESACLSTLGTLILR